MMKKLLLLTICLVLVVSFGANAQYRFLKNFPDNNFALIGGGGTNNGIAVDPAGKVWVESYSGTVDSILTNVAGVYKKCLDIYVFNPNGSQASFSPIKVLSAGGVTDTLAGSGYGMCVDPSSGNILAVVASRNLWKIDYKTGKAISRLRDPIPGYASSLASVAADAFGEVFLCPVVAPGAVAILNPDFSAAGLVAANNPDIGRCINVSSDGNDVYTPRFTSKKTYWYHSDNGSLGPYVLKDSILTNFVIETSGIHPKTGVFYVGSGNIGSGAPDPPYQSYRWYGYNLTTKKVVDSIAWNGDVSADPRPRGIAFSPTGDTVYVGQFQLSVAPVVQMFVKGAVGVEKDASAVPTGYALPQNFPNPFNPSTEIKFEIAKTGMTTLKVYDIMGREVSTLVNETMNAGAYTVKFDASHLSSGTYIYVLESGGNRLTNKMILLK